MIESKYPSLWMSLTGNLGGIYPWYTTIGKNLHFSLDINELISLQENSGRKLEIDLASVANKIYFPFLVDDRTLIKDLRRAPWMSYPENGRWLKYNLPQHNHFTPDPHKFTIELKSALLQEVSQYIQGNKNIGILLSGGMDSRVLAGIVKEYQSTYDPHINITCITWGEANSRDVLYAQKIALQLAWEWEYIELSSETLFQNVRLSAENGAEVAPMHYHAMDAVSKVDGLDLILAGSYGDSIGRGEYSGTHISKLKDLTFYKSDRFGLMKYSAKKQLIPLLEESIHKNTSSENPIRRRELQQQQHYLRRMLQTSMSHITKKTPLFQIFTAPEVYGKMWGLDPNLRDDKWYIRLLNELPGNLLSIQWARTGLLYGQKGGSVDNHTKNYHSYGKWLRNDLRSEVVEAVNSPTIRNMNIFNNHSLDIALSVWTKATTTSVNYFDELFSWLMSFKIFLEENNIEIPFIEFPSQIQDAINVYKSKTMGELYIRARNRKRL